MNMRKQLVPLVVICTLPFVMSCEKFLDRKPLQATIEDIPGALDGQAKGLYGAIRNSASEPFIGDGLQNIPWIAMNGFRSDDAEIIADPGASAWRQTYDNFQYTKDDWGAGLYWDKHYVMIGQCNSVLNTADANNFTDERSMVNRAEARFFRAYTYFDMVRTFGDVPIIDFIITKPTDNEVEKSPAAMVWSFIDEDLAFAEQYLPVTWEPKYAGRLTRGAAKALRAKALLYNQQWAQALGLLKEVINNEAAAGYGLLNDYWRVFKEEGELSSESVFEIQASKTSGDGNIYWSRLGQSQGVRGSGNWDLGWGWNTPTQELVDSYESGDKRKDATILYSNQSDGGVNTGGYGLTVPNLSNAKYWNKKVYNRFERYIEAGLGTPNNEAQNTWINHRVIRYADVLLMAAEAANEVGGGTNGTDAAGWVNRVRERAGLDPVTFTDQATMRDIIKQERRAEFAMEYERFYDLVRWGDAIEVLGPLGYQNKHRYFPIPTPALNGNPKLTQNPEW
jgi:hypothetical protein